MCHRVKRFIFEVSVLWVLRAFDLMFLSWQCSTSCVFIMIVVTVCFDVLSLIELWVCVTSSVFIMDFMWDVFLLSLSFYRLQDLIFSFWNQWVMMVWMYDFRCFSSDRVVSTFEGDFIMTARRFCWFEMFLTRQNGGRVFIVCFQLIVLRFFSSCHKVALDFHCFYLDRVVTWLDFWDGVLSWLFNFAFLSEWSWVCVAWLSSDGEEEHWGVYYTILYGWGVYYTVLYGWGVYYTVLYSWGVYYTVRLRSILYCTVWLRGILYCTVWLRGILYCTVWLRGILYCTVQLRGILYCTVWLRGILYCTVQLRGILYYTVLYGWGAYCSYLSGPGRGCTVWLTAMKSPPVRGRQMKRRCPRSPRIRPRCLGQKGETGVNRSKPE